MSPRRMEEASVAGESPDKSEQQKSSGTTRSEADPRLAVFREPASPAESGSGTDTETAVFRTQRAEPATADAEGGAVDDGAADVGAVAESGKGPEADAEVGFDADGDAEVSASSDGAERDEEPDVEPDEVTPAEPGAAAGAEGAGEAAEGAESPAGGPEAGPDAAQAHAEPEEPVEDVEPAEDEGAVKPSAPADELAVEPADESADEPAGESAEAAGSEGGDARLRAAVAAWVSKDEDAEGADAKGADAKVADAKSEASDADVDVDVDAGDDAAVAEAAPKSAPASKPDAASKADAASGPDAASKPDVDQTPTGSADAKAVSGSEAPDDASEARVPRTREESGKEAQPAGDARGIDQATAVFKMPRLPRVDQPTTALKITPPPAGPTSEIGSRPETPAERTSKFVPLRADDVRPAPAPRTPQASAPPGAGQQQYAASLSGAERTRQQPMPPRPPLDLLAELTNTPPPPETPVRTAVRRVKIWTPLVLLLLIVFAVVQMVRPLPAPALTMTAESSYTFKGTQPSLPWPSEGQGYMAATGLGKIDSFGEQKPVPIASVAKAMTAYLVLKDHPLKRGEKGPGIKIDARAESEGGLTSEGESTLNTVKEGDVLTEHDALAALMIPSANNIARLLARWNAGSEEAFVKKMNATADELGMKNTTYTDPSGLTASTVSTAEDLVKLGEKLVEFPALMDITKLPEWKDPSGKKWRNYNTLVPYDNALGIKTGSTTKAGGNLLFAAHKMIDGTDQLIVGAVLGQHRSPIIDTVNAASKKVMLATLDLLEGAKVVKKGDVVGTVDNGMGGTAPVVATKDVKAVGWSGLTVRLELTDDGKTIPHSAAAGTHVGTLTVGEGSSQVKVAVALQSDMAEPTTGDKLTRIG